MSATACAGVARWRFVRPLPADPSLRFRPGLALQPLRSSFAQCQAPLCPLPISSCSPGDCVHRAFCSLPPALPPLLFCLLVASTPCAIETRAFFYHALPWADFDLLYPSARAGSRKPYSHAGSDLELFFSPVLMRLIFIVYLLFSFLFLLSTPRRR